MNISRKRQAAELSGQLYFDGAVLETIDGHAHTHLLQVVEASLIIADGISSGFRHLRDLLHDEVVVVLDGEYLGVPSGFDEPVADISKRTFDHETNLESVLMPDDSHISVTLHVPLDLPLADGQGLGAGAGCLRALDLVPDPLVDLIHVFANLKLEIVRLVWCKMLLKLIAHVGKGEPLVKYIAPVTKVGRSEEDWKADTRVLCEPRLACYPGCTFFVLLVEGFAQMIKCIGIIGIGHDEGNDNDGVMRAFARKRSGCLTWREFGEIEAFKYLSERRYNAYLR